MAKQQQQLSLPDQIAEVVSTAEPAVPAAPAAAPEVTPEQIAQLILKSSDQTKAAIRKALDLDNTHTRERKSVTTNSQVRISDRGPEAVAIWKQRWKENNGDNLSEYDLDHMALDAHL